jgi:N-acetylmuramoyl-L-alanine amidase
MISRIPLIALLSLAAYCLTLDVPTGAAAGSRRQQAHPLVVVLDSGHGGSDTGAVDLGLEEKLLTLAVVKRAAADLTKMGYKVYLTRTSDKDVNTPPRDLNHDGAIDDLDELDARTLFANRHHANLFVSIHFDAELNSPAVHGTHGYYCPARSFWRQSKRLATLLTASVSQSLSHSGYSDPNLGVQTDVADKIPQRFADYPWFFQLGPSWPHRITGTSMPGALIETLYLTSPRDAAAIRRRGTIAALAQGYANGINAYFTEQKR